MLHLLLARLRTVESHASIPRQYMYELLIKVNGWPNGFAFLLSWLAPAWTIGAFALFQT